MVALTDFTEANAPPKSSPVAINGMMSVALCRKIRSTQKWFMGWVEKGGKMMSPHTFLESDNVLHALGLVSAEN
jgi:hypothetical protein